MDKNKKTSKVTMGEFRDNFSEYVNLAKYQGQRILIMRHGKVMGAFISVEDLNKIELLDNPSDRENQDQKSDEHHLEAHMSKE